MICQACGVEAPTKQVEFRQNIGALFMRFHRKIKGNLCKSCVHKNFWKMTGITLAVGWLGMISLVVAPIFIVMNVVNYLRCAGMPPVPPMARPPELTDQIMTALHPQAQQIMARLNAGEDAKKIAADVAYTSGATPGQVVLYIRGLVKAAQQQRPLPPLKS